MSFQYWGWEDSWLLLLILAAAAALGLGGVAITADHSIQYYFLDKGIDGNPCVMAYRNWTSNDKVFCSDDISRVTDTLNKLNAGLRSGTERAK